MCEPTTLTVASIAVAGAGAGASIMGQSQQNSAAKQVEQQKANAIDKQIEETRRRATDDYVASVQDEMLLESQEHESLAEQNIDLSRKERDAVSQATVAAGESGVVGQSLAAIVNDYNFQQEQAAGRLGINQAWRDSQHQRNIEAAERTYYNRASSARPYQAQPTKPVDFYGPTFSILQTGLDTGLRTGLFEGAIRKNPLST